MASLQKAVLADRRGLLDPAFDLPRGMIERIVSVHCRFLRQRTGLFAERVHRRFVLDGHGDLRPEHIRLSKPFPIIDCLEFNARLRASDALDEIAFLHLDCARLGARCVGERLRRHMAVQRDDDPSSGLFLFYRIGRPMLRARLSIAHLADPIHAHRKNGHVKRAPISPLQRPTLRNLSGSSRREPKSESRDHSWYGSRSVSDSR